VNGGYSLSYYLSGAITGELLELELRSRTGGRRGMDDVLRLMLARHAGARGFGTEDIVRAVNDACGCDLQEFFSRHIQGRVPLPAARALALAGLRLVVDTVDARAADGTVAPDLRLSIISWGGMGSAGGPAGGRPRLSVGNAESVWGRAGIVTGDELVSIDGRPVADAAAATRPAGLVDREALAANAKCELRHMLAGEHVSQFAYRISLFSVSSTATASSSSSCRRTSP
jgi:predicted metalloprotease with PDZ domain